MIAYKELQDVLKITVGWEKKLNDLYDVAEIGLRNKESRKIIAFLKEKQIRNLEILKNININDYGRTEWVRYASDYREEDLIPSRNITKDSPPEEIFSHIVEYEEKLKEFYSSIVSLLVTEEQKELFSSLVTFKESQISEIKNLMARQY
ncbi:MAG TPA: hypothetical protein ENI06_10720 [Spirochaetales bacterium]|nr:hypothetical protein [Spirochaetales bacterium]